MRISLKSNICDNAFSKYIQVYYYKILTSDYDLYDIINDHELSCVCKGNIDNSALHTMLTFSFYSMSGTVVNVIIKLM